MKIDGKKISESISENLKVDLKNLASKKIFPALAVVLMGSDKSSQIYVGRKVKMGKLLGIKVLVLTPPDSISVSKFKNFIEKLNRDINIHAVIIQRPLPLPLSDSEIGLLVDPAKDVDGFHPKSDYDPPVALAVFEIIKSIHQKNTLGWLKHQPILVIGRGVTAGKPVADYFSRLGIKIQQANSKTENLPELIKAHNIIISCVGKSDVVRHLNIKSNHILIGVGLHPENDKLIPDYNQEEVAKSGALYTPVPGGVGPVNVAMLMKNVVKAAKSRDLPNS